MPLWRFPPTRPPYQPQPRQFPTGRTLVSTTFPLTVTTTQAQSLSVAQSRVYLRTVSLTQAQSVSVGLVPTLAQHYSLTVTAVTVTTLSVTVLQGRLPNNYYATTFPLTENPISESNVWSLGGTDGLDWNNPRTTPGRVFGTQSGTDSPPYTDSVAVLKGTWGADQEANATIFGVAPPSGAYYTEVELLLRFTITAHSTVGYEVTISVNASNNYIQVNRWTGGPGGSLSSYVQVGATTFHTISNGDVMRATIVGSTITLYQNGTQILQVTDSTVTTGKPGIGFYNQDNGAHANPATYGFANYTAHTIGTPWPLGGTILQGQSSRLVQQVQLRRALTVNSTLPPLARFTRLTRAIAQPQAVLLSVASRVIPLLRSVTQPQAVSLAVRKVILRVVNTSQGQAAQLATLTRLGRTLLVTETTSVAIHSAGGGTIYSLTGGVAVQARPALTWVQHVHPKPTRPPTPPLLPLVAVRAPALLPAVRVRPPSLVPAYTPTIQD